MRLLSGARVGNHEPPRNRLFPKTRSWFALGSPLELLSPLSVLRVLYALAGVTWSLWTLMLRRPGTDWLLLVAVIGVTAAVWLVLASLILPGLSPRGAINAIWRDAGQHRSPNAGWPEAAIAGALGLRLGGPRAYDGTMRDEPWMGDGRERASARDIRAALRQYRVACAIQFAVVAGLAAAMAFL